MIYIGADHRGFEKKNELIKFLKAKNVDVKDAGAYSYDPDDDFNDPAVTVARSVRREHDSVGILLCGSSHGIAMQANRFKGVRAISATTEESAKLGREHNNANVLCLSADTLSQEEIENITKVFLTTKFSNIPRYIHRNNRLDEREDYA